jgi:hypothetical protein
MTVALVLLIAGLWLLSVGRSRPRPPSRPRLIVEIEFRRPTAHIEDVDLRGGL